MRNSSRRVYQEAARLLAGTPLGFLVYRYRYLVVFTLIGFLSIMLEVQMVEHLFPSNWPLVLRAITAFPASLVLSFALNATFNFRVPRSHLLATFRRFTLVSVLSFSLNMAAMAVSWEWLSASYGNARYCLSACLFLIAYSAHRRFTFDLSRNFGVAVYAAKGEDVDLIYELLGRNCDHVHVDLIDSTMNSSAAEVDLGKITRVRQLWSGMPICLHVMSLFPSRWIEQVWGEVDWFLFHVNVREDLYDLIMKCRLRGKKVGVVWHVSDPVWSLLPYLPHVDFAVALGIAEPGHSGQQVLDEAITVIVALDRLRGRYHFETMFDGGVKPSTLVNIPARYVVAASAVLRASDPIHVAHSIRTGVRYERKSA